MAKQQSQSQSPSSVLEVGADYFRESFPTPQYEVYPLPIKDGNPEFNFETERDVFVRSIYKDHPMPSYMTTCPSISNFHGKKDAGDEVLWEFQKTADGKLVMDDYGHPKRVITEDPSQPGHMVHQKWVLNGHEIKLRVPQDNDKIKQLLRWPRNASVSTIDGLPTNPVPKVFYIYDPLQEEQSDQVKRAAEERAVDFVKNIPGRALFAYTVHFGLLESVKPSGVRVRGQHPTYKESDLLYAVERFAREYSQEFLDEVKGNLRFNDEVLISCSRHFGVIIEQTDGFYYVPENGRAPVQIGITEDQVLNFLRLNAHIKEDVITRSKYRDFRDDTAVYKVEEIVYQDDPATNKVDGELLRSMMQPSPERVQKDNDQEALMKDMMEKIKALQAQLAKPEAKPEAQAPTKKKPGPKKKGA